MSVVGEAIRKVTGRFNTPLESWGCTNSPSYHVDRFRTHMKCPNKMDPDMVERVKWSIQKYAQHNSAMGAIRDYHRTQYGRGQTS